MSFYKNIARKWSYGFIFFRRGHRGGRLLADRMRPENLDEYIGQEHIIGRGKLLRRAIEADQVSSILLYGPPGCGKTTLAHIISHHTQGEFVRLNAVEATVKDVREVIERAQNNQTLYGTKTILFLDEVHRFNSSRQDALLPAVEKGPSPSLERLQRTRSIMLMGRL